MVTNSIVFERLLLGLGSRSYPIYIGYDILSRLGELCPNLSGKATVIVSTQNVAKHFLPIIENALRKSNAQTFSIILPDGEKEKKLSNVDLIATKMLEKGLTRTSVILALGGGVIGDLSGFAASVYLRGIDFIQIPTTLLSQVDSSVGGKTGVNHRLGKNMIGTFYQPKSVIIDLQTLETLPDKEFTSGVSEVIKYGCIEDGVFFEWIEQNCVSLKRRSTESLAHAIKKSCEIKSQIVEEDEKEAGKRALLNFGHTFGHAIENGLGYGEWLHGEAISVGMVMASKLSCEQGYIQNSGVERVTDLLKRFELPVIPPAFSADLFLDLMKKDKKNKDNKLNYILLESIGKAFMKSFEAKEISNFLKKCQI